MFAKATRKFVHEIDPDGCLIPVSRLNESDNLRVLSLVIKRNPFWLWQQPKYMPTDFTLNDLLTGENQIHPVLVETDFLKYDGTMEKNATGGAGAEIGPGNLNVEGKGLSKMAYSFGDLKKQEVDVQKLLHACKDKCLDFQHCLLKQTVQRQRDVFALVKERIVTTQTCTVTEKVQEGGSCSAFLGFTVPKKIQVSVKNGSIHCDSNVFLEIPPKTALAYSLMELNVKNTGQFELCLMPDTLGCFEVDGLDVSNPTTLNSAPSQSPVQKLQQELDKLQVHFKVLSGLPASTRSNLFPHVTLVLKDKTAITTLDLALEEALCGRTCDLSTLDKVPTMKKTVHTILELLGEKKGASPASVEGAQSESTSLSATNVLTNALEEMSESTLVALHSCCHQPTILAIHQLVQNVLENKECSLSDSTLAPLAEEDTYKKVQELLMISNVTLTKDEKLIQAEISAQEGHRPLILFIAIYSLASLVSPSG